MLMYVDDGLLYVSSMSIGTNIRLLKSAYQKTSNWLTKVGLSADMDKRELMHYTRRPSAGSPAIRLPGADGQETTIVTFPYTRWLGVFLDRKLLFNHHVKILTAKAENTVHRLSMLANTIKGLSQEHVRRLYRACVIPVLTYASPVWWTGKKNHEKQLTRIQNRALRLICATFRTTPIHALEIEASVPPIRLALDYNNRCAAIRINKLPTGSPVIQRLPDTWREGRAPRVAPPIMAKQPRNRKKANKATTQLAELAKLTSPNDERIFPFLTPPWRRLKADFGERLKISATTMDKEEAAEDHMKKIEKIERSPNHMLIYTDGSQRPIHRVRRSGAGITIRVAREEIYAQSIGLGSKAEVYDGELMGLSRGAQKAVQLARERNISHLLFFADNTSAICAAFDPKPRQGQLLCHIFHNAITGFLDENENNTVEVNWAPGHQDIPGNDRADELAKAGVELESAVTGTRAAGLRKAKGKLIGTWTKEWKSRPKSGRFAMADRMPPKLKTTERFIKTKREVFGRLIQCRTGHGFLGEYYKQFVPDENVDCPCGEPFQTREHILRDCPKYQTHRHILEEVSRDISLPEILGTEKGIEALIDFLEESGAFTKTGKPTPKPREPSFDEEPNPAEDEDEDPP
jgi:ribonuclease HI